MKLVMDCETTIHPPEGWEEGQSLLKGNPSPYIPDNELVSIQYSTMKGKVHTLFKENFDNFQAVLDKTTLLIGFNIKFDLSWIRECGFTYEGEIYDCQLAEYILEGGRLITPSLNDVSESYGLPQKLDEVKELWKAGINTNEIDRKILAEYGEYDVYLTEQVYLRQQERLSDHNDNEESEDE